MTAVGAHAGDTERQVTANYRLAAVVDQSNPIGDRPALELGHVGATSSPRPQALTLWGPFFARDHDVALAVRPRM